ncbi:MAG: OB-fold nucleic acid binding domain-containing protein [Nanoarchaeota archaeon]
MFNISYEDIINKIKEEKDLSEEEIKIKVKEKLTKLSDLISKEGAAHIVANELGVKLFNISKELKVEGLISGMNNVIITGKVVQVNPVVEFKKENREGKVGSFVIGDETGVIRVAFWDTNHIKFIEDRKIKEGSILKISNAYVKSNNGFKELHVGNRGDVEIDPSGIEIEVQDKPSFDFVRKKITELSEGESNVGILGTIVQVFEPRFYEACPECNKKLENSNGKFSCKQHGQVSEVLVPILNVFLDDGTDNIRVVAFRNQAERLLNLDLSKILEFRENPESFNNIRDEILGKQLVIVGRVIKNEMFDRKELMAQRIIEVKPEELVKELENA